jgi:hypothetical protein
MLRLFADCLELSDPTSDGWIVIGGLVKSYNKEKVPVSENSVNWILRLTSTEKIVAFGAKSIWHGLQHAVRAFLVHERDNQVLQRLLNLTESVKKAISASHATSIAHWLALRASQRELLPMIVEAGRFLRMDGFDWVEDGITPSQFVRALPVIYAAWAQALPSGIDKVEELISLELDEILDKSSWTQESLLEAILADKEGAESQQHKDSMRCSACDDDYSSLGTGLVSPIWIAFTECNKTEHKFHCSCAEFLQKIGAMETTADDTDDDLSDVDEEFYRETDEAIDELCAKYMKICSADQRNDPFRDAATLLYRAQGRRWLSLYKLGDLLCATCFLGGEEYIGEAGLGTEGSLSPMPESYGAFCSDNYSSAIEKED